MGKKSSEDTNPTRRLFGTDGIRGLANRDPMSPDMMLKLGTAIGNYFKLHYHQPKIVIGKDTRRSGYMLEQALSSGICSAGVDTAFLGPIPTPGIAYLTRGLRANAGIVISASHNPFDDNGVKIFTKDGYKLPDSVEATLEDMAFGQTQPNLPTGKGIGRSRRMDDAIGQYAVFLKEQFPKHLTLDGLRIVVDCANGAGYQVAPKVFEELGAEVFVLGDDPNGFNINEQCGALHPQKLQEKVRLYKADLGVALDGDADRLVLVDGNAEIVDGDEILAIYGTYLSKHGRLKSNTVVATIMSNLGLEIALNRVGGRLVRTQVGDRYVVEEMRKNDYNIGGEQSGHLVFRDCSTTGDGILAALHVMEVILEEGKSLQDLKKCMTRIPQVLKSFTVKKKLPLSKMPDLEKSIEKMEKKLGDRGRVLFRYSGTEKKARIMIEGDDQKSLEEMASDLAEQTIASINQYGTKDDD